MGFFTHVLTTYADWAYSHINLNLYIVFAPHSASRSCRCESLHAFRGYNQLDIT